jgi:signal transduction histidine kinase
MEHIKRHDPDIEIIVVTGYASLESAVRGLRNQVFDYVTKPFDVPQISTLVHRALERRRESLRARRVKDDFLANLSHALRTPLSAIIGYNSILTEELHTRLNEDQRVAFDRIQANSQKLLNLIETVLLLNSLDAGELRFTLSTFDVRETLRRVARQFAAAARQRGLGLTVEGELTPIWATSDEHKLERILWALIDNAVKFTPDGSIALGAHPVGRPESRRDQRPRPGVGIHNTDIAQLVEDIVPAPTPAPAASSASHASRLTDFLGGSLRARRAERWHHFTISIPVLVADPHESGVPNA